MAYIVRTPERVSNSNDISTSLNFLELVRHFKGILSVRNVFLSEFRFPFFILRKTLGFVLVFNFNGGE